MFTKRYRAENELRTALGHYRWLSGLGSEVAFPAVLGHTATVVAFEYVTGRTTEPADLPAVAKVLGILHRAARRSGLAHAHNNSRYTSASGLTLQSFACPRRARVHRLLQQPDLAPLLSAPVADRWLDLAELRPATLYKDANPRNALITPSHNVVLLDFDDLTLAPAGYDLAKLIVTAAMTFGRLPRALVDEAIASYAAKLDCACPDSDVVVWCEFHHLLTHAYLNRHGYQHAWPAVRPWAANDVRDALDTAREASVAS